MLILLMSQWVNLLAAQTQASVRNVSYRSEIQTAQPSYRMALNQATLTETFDKIEKTTGFRFVYNESKIGQINNINIADGNYTLDRLLTIVEIQTGLQFKQINNMIAVSKGTKATPQYSGQTSPVSTTNPTNTKTDITTPPILGKITDQKGEPLVGVNVVIKGTTKGATTDLEGNFQLDAKEGDVLVISLIGFKKQEVTVGNAPLSIRLEEETSLLSEVAVIGSRGKARTDVDRPVPVDVLNAKELQLTGQTDLGQMVQFSSPSFNSAKTGKMV